MASDVPVPARNLRKDFLTRFMHLLLARRENLIVITILLIHFLLISPSLMPTFTEINSDDEAKYIESGWRLLNEGPRDLAWGPLVSLVYAPVHLLVGDSPSWFMIEAWVGRFLLFFLLWLSTYYLALQFKEYFHPLIAVGVLFISIYFLPVIENQSDALFVSMSAFALSRVIAYYRTQHLRDIGLASLFVGLGVLCRVETILLVGTLAVIALVIRRGRHGLLKVLSLSVVPAAVVLAVFILTSLVTKGHLNLGISDKAFASFEMNQPGQQTIESPGEDAGSPLITEDGSEGSIFRAIAGNPSAFIGRIFVHALEQPGYFLDFYGKKLGPVLLLLSAWGIFTLVRRRSLTLLLILLIWPLHALVSLAFFARHVVPQASYLPIILSAVGIAEVFRPDIPRKDRVFLFLTALLISFFSLLFDKPAILAGGLVLAAVLALTWLIQPRQETTGSYAAIPLLILFAAGLILRGSYPFPNFPVLGSTVEEQAVTYIHQEFDPLSKLLSTSSYPMLAAKMVAIDVQDVPVEVTSPQMLSDWLENQEIEGIYLDSRKNARPEFVRVIESGLVEQFEVGYASEDGAVRILILKDP
ncbi:MAG: hypothetical protein EHM41_15040 [Chloroflexi bacterium]|nr:MAG: hypothetical protein EHM41_15040 [Chloroflexota bacterium]